jgi:hypothetical protein
MGMTLGTNVWFVEDRVNAQRKDQISPDIFDEDEEAWRLLAFHGGVMA